MSRCGVPGQFEFKVARERINLPPSRIHEEDMWRQLPLPGWTGIRTVAYFKTGNTELAFTDGAERCLVRRNRDMPNWDVLSHLP